MNSKLFITTILIAFTFVGCIPKLNLDLEKTPKVLPGTKVEIPPEIDGILDDDAWKNAPRGGGFTDRNAGGALAKDQTKIMMVYTDLAVYVAWYIYDENPDELMAFETQHQMRPYMDDWVSFTLDPFHTHQFQDRVFFITNPNGVKYVSHPPVDVEMEDVPLLWNVAAEIVEDGWIVEMEIPWNMLDYPQTDKPITFGINFDRGHPRTGANSWWSKVPSIENDRMDGHWINVLPPIKK